jgi:hypothetical protein
MFLGRVGKLFRMWGLAEIARREIGKSEEGLENE